MTDAEGEAIQRAVGHAIGLYRSVLEGLGVDPFAGLPGHDTPAAITLARLDRLLAVNVTAAASGGAELLKLAVEGLFP